MARHSTSGSAAFTFDTEFRSDGDVVSNAARARQRRSYTVEEIDILCSRARAEGENCAQVRAAEAAARAVEDLSQSLHQALQSAGDEIEKLRREAAALGLAAARKLAPAALAALPIADVEAALREAMHQAIGEPRVLLRVPPAVAAALKDRLAQIAHEEGYEGRVQIAADPALLRADCRIEWRGGGSERSEADITAALEALIERRFSQSHAQSHGPSHVSIAED